jgi:hypothetical protein
LRKLVTLDLDEYDTPERPDFRRIGRGKVPYVLDEKGKRIRYGRSSNAGKILDDESNLTDWKLRTVVAGAAQRPELMAEASTLDVDSDKNRLRDIAEDCLVAGKGQRRAIIGSAVHAMFDHLDRRDGWTPPPNFLPICDAYESMMAEWGFEVQGIEVHCINDRFHLAGTLDRRYRTTKTLVAPDGTIIPIGSTIVSDHKTGKELEYASGAYCTQLAAYVDSQMYDVKTDEREPFDPPNFPDWALIVHADSAGTEIHLYWVDVQQGREGLELAAQVKGWRRRDSLLRMASAPVAPHPVNLPATAPVGPSTAPRLALRVDHLRGRINAIRGHGDVATRQLQRDWPQGVPGLKFDGHSWADLDAIEKVIERVEADHSIPFGDSFIDPVAQSIANHPSNHRRVVPNLVAHPRATMLNRWIESAGVTGESPIAIALLAYADLSADEWSDEDLETMLLGSLRGLELGNLDTLDALTNEDANRLLQVGFAIAAGSAILLFDNEGNPVVRVITER